MILSELNYFAVATGFFLWSLFNFSWSDHDKLSYSKKATITADHETQQTSIITFRDTLSEDPLFFVKSKESNTPLYYFKDITTDVCFDNECRLLRVSVYWNITGRYLGFDLPKGEFLSKRDHQPFSDDEYERLNDLLANPDLPLGQISFEKLIEVPAPALDSIDGVSGATTKDVSQMVVKGAAYTTYTLWNIVHGPTQDFVARNTAKLLSPDLIDLILKSPDQSDQVWVLDKIRPNSALTEKLTNTLREIIAGDDFFLAYSALNAIKPSHLDSNKLQSDLFSIYENADHSIQRMIIEKLMKAPFLHSELVISSRKLLVSLNGKQLGDLLKLYTKHAIKDEATIEVVAEILNNENRFIARQAYNFLKATHLSDKEIEELRNK
ncbi:MAG: hypothetical protein KTR30_30765 [Saprospiraceae bacterium]|nr:hypothetical protein [Saprospiraceae bacterium]